MNEHEAFDADGAETNRPSDADGSIDWSTHEEDQDITTAPPTRPSRAKRIIGFGAAAVVLLGIGAGGGALATLRLQDGQQATAALGSSSAGTGTGQGSTGSSGSTGGFGSGGGFGSQGSTGGFGSQGSTGGFGSGGFGSGGFGSGGSSASGSGSTGSGTAATAAQEVGVVTVLTTLGYESGEAAGTGIVLTSNGEILTNNHVIEGSTAIKVTVQSTGKTYTASVVGDDPTDDVAVLQLKDASGLATAKLSSSAATVGESVTGVGNAGGTGTLTAASGTVTALQQSITTEAEGSAASENLTGLVETDADIVSGDSGGPLETGSGAVVGIDTAASSGSAQVTGYAIPIATAERIADEILSGSTSSSITLGLPGFLGVEVAQDATTDGAGVDQVIPGTPAASAGLESGDVITAVDGKTVGSPSALTTLLHSYKPGDKVTITYADSDGASHTTTVTLTTGPAD